MHDLAPELRPSRFGRGGRHLELEHVGAEAKLLPAGSENLAQGQLGISDGKRCGVDSREQVTGAR